MLKKRLGVRADIQAYERLHSHLIFIEQLSRYHSRLAGSAGTKQSLEPLFKWGQK